MLSGMPSLRVRKVGVVYLLTLGFFQDLAPGTSCLGQRPHSEGCRWQCGDGCWVTAQPTGPSAFPRPVGKCMGTQRGDMTIPPGPSSAPAVPLRTEVGETFRALKAGGREGVAFPGLTVSQGAFSLAPPAPPHSWPPISAAISPGGPGKAQSRVMA